MDKKILIISTAFPPRIGSGSKRVCSISNGLVDFGWKVFVLTLEKEYYDFEEEDENLISPKVRVFRTRAFLPKTGKDKSLWKMVIMALFHFILIPDRFLAWFPFGFKKGMEIIKKENIDIIYSSAPSFSVHLLARKFKKKTGKKWIAEFRDPWTKNISFDKKFFIKRVIEKRMEKGVFKECDKIISAGPHITELNKHVFDRNFEKFHTISSGFNQENIVSKNHSIFTISYFGTNYPFFKDAFADFLGAVDYLLEKKMIEEDKIKVNIFDRKNWLNHREALAEMKKSSVLLVMGLNSRGAELIPGKLYEYLSVKKPILAIDKINSHLGRIVNRTNSGKVVSGKDAIAKTILEYYNNFYHGGISHNPNYREIERYNYKNICKELSFLLDDLL